MKKFLPALLLFLFSKTISAQQYFPTLDSANEWSYSNLEIAIGPQMQQPNPCSYPAMSTPGMSYKEYTSGDTVIGAFTYKILINNWNVCAVGYVREDTAARKIYFIDNLSSTEHLLYNFSMQPGDTISCNFIMSNNGYVSGLYTLDSISNITIDAGVRKQFWLSCHASPGSKILSWVESVGCLSYFIYPFFFNDTNYPTFSSCPGVQHAFPQYLTCFDHNSKVYFDGCAYNFAQNNSWGYSVTDSCDYFSFIGGINELPSLISASVFPNPSSGKTTVSLDVKQAADFEITMRDISGKKILKAISLGKINEGKKEVELDVSSFNDGIYFLEIKSDQGSVYKKIIVQH